VGADGRGPAWSNSLFEDNAEFGLGMRLGVDALRHRAEHLLARLAGDLPDRLVAALSADGSGDDADVAARREQIVELRRVLDELATPEARELSQIADQLVPRSMWIVGGDGWAYDIGYGGLDHILASNRNVNVLVLDTEVYSNTGGQQSKSTPLGAIAKFASAGKESPKKDLGLLAMSYGHVYVASIAIQARGHRAITALMEAESYPGPSLVIAHSPCIAHGYDLVNSVAQQQRAIKSGAWPLFRFDPRRIAEGHPPLQIDADPMSIPIRDYMEQEPRFRMVELRDPDRYRDLVDSAQAAVRRRHDHYEQLSHIHLDARLDSSSSSKGPDPTHD
jgi:pyruvate-ferredoxin/flavodoxin oxidoreductase